jgi:hypothetical protein
MPPRKNKQQQGGSIGDIARNVARAGLLATTAIAPEFGVPLDIGATLLGLGRRLKSIEDKIEKQRVMDGDSSPVIVDPKNVRTDHRVTSNVHPRFQHDSAQYENDVTDVAMKRSRGGSEKIGGKYVIAGSEKIGGKYVIAGSEKVGGAAKGKSPLYETIRSIT